MKINNKKFFYSTSIVIGIFILDFATKFYVKENYDNLIYGYNMFNGLNLVYVENKGVSFGLFSEFDISRTLGVISFLISGYIIYLIRKSSYPIEILGLSLILGGAIGNGYERIFQGFVVDFIDVYINRYHWPSFNIADLSITVGAIFFLISIARHN